MFSRVTIVGVGLLGGSLGLAIKSRWPGCRVVGYGHRQATLDLALSKGAIDEFAPSAAESVREADLVVICTPVGLIPDYLREIADHLRPGAIVTDVGSTKLTIVQAGESLVREPAFFVGSHPMAGSENRGVDAARPDLFKGATCIVTRQPTTNPQAAELVSAFWTEMGMRVIHHTAADHDRLVALVSHLPHIAAAALVRMQTLRSLEVAGRGYQDSTRIAAGDARLWRDILLDNRVQIIPALSRLIDELRDLESALRVQDRAEVELWLREASEIRARQPAISASSPES